MGGKTISTEAQKIATIRLQTSAYGLVIPFGYGTNRVSGNLIWYANFTPIAHTTTQSSGGKGIGKVTQKDTSYTYTAAIMMALGEGQIAGVRTVWKGKDQTTLSALGLTLFPGARDQAAWSYLSGYVGDATNIAHENAYGYASQAVSFNQAALPYSSTAYLAAAAYDLGTDASVPNHGFEVQWPLAVAGKDDANPAAFTPDLLTSAQYGAGFPAGMIGDLTAWSNYCLAAGLLFSPAYTEARPASDCLTELTDASNAAVVWSEGLLKVIPYGDAPLAGNGATFSPNATPIYDLDDDDFLADDGADPITITRTTPADRFNRVQVEFLNRANQYNTEIVTVEDQLAIETYGLKIAPIAQMHFICDAGVAKIAAQLALQRYLFKPNTYAFKLGWQYDLLEPMDLVTVTDAALGLSQYPVRIIAIEEDEEGTLSIEAEDFPLGVAAATRYPHDSGQRYQANLNATPQSPATPFIFELPADPSATGLAVGVAAGGQPSDPIYGGCRVWLSLDGTNYKAAGTIYGSSRYGSTTSALAASTAGIDVAHQLCVGLRSNGQLLNGSSADLAKGTTLIRIGGEYLAYLTATLTGARAYTLSNLNRGLFGTTPAAADSGTSWVRVDDAIAKLTDLDLALIGQTVHIKLTAFNTYGAGEQDLATATEYTFTITGAMYQLGTNARIQAEVAAIGSDLVLSAGSEKSKTIIDWQAIYADMLALTSQYGALGSPSDLTTSYNLMRAAVDGTGGLAAYLGSLSPAWNDKTVDTPIAAATWEAKWEAANDAVSAFRASITGRKGDKGDDGISAYAFALTNENMLLPADADGNITSYAAASTDAQVIAGEGDVTASFALSVVDNPQGLAFTLSGHTLSITGGYDASETTASLKLRATGSGDYADLVLDRQVTLVRSRASLDGSSPPLISLDAGPLIAHYDADDVIEAEDVHFTAIRQNLDFAATFQLVALAGSVMFTGSAAAFVASDGVGWSSSDDDHLTLNASNLASVIAAGGGGFIMVVSAGDVSDRVTVRKVKDGANGANGAPGSSNAEVRIYQRAVGAPALPTASTTYAFGSGAITGLNNGWSATPPDGADPLYMTVATASSAGGSDAIGPGEWAMPVILARNGTSGEDGDTVRSKSLFIYQRAGSAPAVPSADATYTFSTQALTDLNNGWSPSIPGGTAPIWVSTASALSLADTDTIAAAEWATPRVLAQNGVDAIDVSIAATANQAKFNAAGVLQTGGITFAATFKNVGGSTIWEIRNLDGSNAGWGPAGVAAFLASGPSYFTSADDGHLTMTAAGVTAFMSGREGFAVRVYSSDGGSSIGATVSVAKVQDGAPGEDGAPGVPGGSFFGEIPGQSDFGMPNLAVLSFSGTFTADNASNIYCEGWIDLPGGTQYLGVVGSGSSGSMTIVGNWTNHTGGFKAVTLRFTVTGDDGGGPIAVSGSGGFAGSVG